MIFKEGEYVLGDLRVCEEGLEGLHLLGDLRCCMNVGIYDIFYYFIYFSLTTR